MARKGYTKKYTVSQKNSKKLPSINPFYHYLKCIARKYKENKKSDVLKYAVQQWRRMPALERQPFFDAACQAKVLFKAGVTREDLCLRVTPKRPKLTSGCGKCPKPKCPKCPAPKPKCPAPCPPPKPKCPAPKPKCPAPCPPPKPKCPKCPAPKPKCPAPCPPPKPKCPKCPAPCPPPCPPPKPKCPAPKPKCPKPKCPPPKPKCPVCSKH